MDYFHGVYWLKYNGTSMYANVYTSPQNMDFDLNITKLLRKCLDTELCYPCGQPDPSMKVSGWIGIRFDMEKMEIQVTIEDISHSEPLFDKTFPVTYNDNV